MIWQMWQNYIQDSGGDLLKSNDKIIWLEFMFWSDKF